MICRKAREGRYEQETHSRTDHQCTGVQGIHGCTGSTEEDQGCTEGMRYLSLFSGAGGGDLAMQHLLGFRCVGYVEYEPYCQKLIKQRIADGFLDAAPIFGDIRAFNSEGYAAAYQGMVDLITGGFPCQDLSCAGNRAGLDGERSGLWKSMYDAICTIKPRYVFVENSPMLTIRGHGEVLRNLAQEGFNARWTVLSCADCGGPHLRERIWIIAYHNSQRGRVHVEWQHKKRRNMGNHKENRTFSDWYGVRFEGKGKILGKEGAYPPLICRVDDGVPFRVERLKACGNAQVPIVAATAFRILAGQ